MADLLQHTQAHSYLLRIWHDRNTAENEAQYRFSLIDPHTRERYNFESLAHMTAFLEDMLRQRAAALGNVNEM